jgi:signal transduction histidine kinase
MRKKWYQKAFRSVFTKLLLIIIVTGIALNLVVVGFFVTHRHMVERSIHQNLIQYINYLIADIGIPPSVDRAREIARQTLLEIHYQSPQNNWSTAGNPPDLSRGRFYVWKESPNIRFGRYLGHSFVEVNRNNGLFIFEFAKPFDRKDRRDGLFFLLLILMLAILGGAFLTIRRVLRPVKWLNEGVKEVSRGNLSHRVPLKKYDELRDLAEAFNAMTERIREMLQAKEQLLLDVSHEMRSPLTRMKVAIEFLPDGKAKESIKTDLNEMENMISEILDTARAHHLHGQLKRQRLNLVDLLHEVIPAFEDRAPGVEIGDIPEVIHVDVDAEQIKIVLNNVLDNAIKYSRPESDPVRIDFERQDPFGIICIQDEGIGIPADELPFIFEPFYRVDKSRSKSTGGYGLGLSLCKTIMEAHDAKISVDSTPGRGTTVLLYFCEISD